MLQAETTRSEDSVLVIARVFNAPRARVWRAWTTDEMSRWAAPRGFTVTHSDADVRPGGAWRATMRSPDGVDHSAHGVYREVVEPERLVFTHAWDEPDAVETVVTVTFIEDDGRTQMTFRQEGFRSVGSRDGHQGGWNEAFDRLGETLAQA